MTPTQPTTKQASIFGLIKSYKLMIVLVLLCAIIVNLGNLVLPKIIARAIDAFVGGNFAINGFIIPFAIVSFGVLLFFTLQTIIQTIASERVARDIRRDLSNKISRQEYIYVQNVGADKLLTNLTSDVDGVKTFVSQAIVILISSVLLIIGAAVLLFTINWKLALAVLAILPVIGIAFAMIFAKAGPLFKRTRESLDWLNRVINESVFGAILIRVVNSHSFEERKFAGANENAQEIGFKVLRIFSLLIPIITFAANMVLAVILALGGHFVIGGSMSLGNFTAFMSYVGVLILPIMMLGFISSMIATAQASYNRIGAVLDAEDPTERGTVTSDLSGDISVDHLTLAQGEKSILKDVSFSIKPGTKTAIIGPTAAGKTQLLYLLIGLTNATSGTVFYDGIPVSEYDPAILHKEIGFVFQDSVMFNTSIRENIAFADNIDPESFDRAIRTAELSDFIHALPQGLDTLVSERGVSLSGGQKQRIMLARALVLNPRILLLDDFTARVDALTEARILENISKEYPDLTLISVTQKVVSVEHYDHIIVLMEGELIAQGTHSTLMDESPEYVQIVESQKSTETL